MAVSSRFRTSPRDTFSWAGAAPSSNRLSTPFAVRAGMVLPVKMGALAHGEIRVLPVEPPYHVPARAGDLVDTPSVPGRDEEIPVRRNGYRVDVEVIERLLSRCRR